MAPTINSTNNNDKLKVYMMTHGHICEIIPDYCLPLEIGAAVRKNFHYNIHDDIGNDNISNKDNLYCELTGLYWIWKNDKHEFTGLCHYRRAFKINSNNIYKYLSKYDLIAPKYYFIETTCNEQYCDNHIREDWVIMLNVLSKMYPEYYKCSKEVFNHHYLLPYNMFIAKHELMINYCEWLFPLLFEIENKIDLNNRSDYQSRVIGFLAERLFTLYISYNKLHIKQVSVIMTPQTPDLSEKSDINDEDKNKIKEYVTSSAYWMRYREWRYNLNCKEINSIDYYNNKTISKLTVIIFNNFKIIYYFMVHLRYLML